MVKIVKQEIHATLLLFAFVPQYNYKHLEKIRLHVAFTLFDNILKRFFEQTKI